MSLEKINVAKTGVDKELDKKERMVVSEYLYVNNATSMKKEKNNMFERAVDS